MPMKVSDFNREILDMWNAWLDEERATLKPRESKVLKRVSFFGSQPADLLIRHGRKGYKIVKRYNDD